MLLPDLSKWNTSSVNNMSEIFSGCSALILLPDLSKWNISSVNNMSKIFSGCSSLIFLPNIPKWNISDEDCFNVINDSLSFISHDKLNKLK